MAKTLLIVESPNKVKKVQKYAGDGYRVMASVGHIRDLPEREIGVAAPDYKPTYEVTNKDVVKRLKAAAKECGGEVLLATDPDREGEAIAWHLAQVLGVKDAQRVTFNEINEGAVKTALNNVRPLNVRQVSAQEARRVLDRLVGYRVSPVLSEIAGGALSAGRVQTPAVRLVVEREEEIESFKATTHYGVRLEFDTGGVQWSAEWDFKPFLVDTTAPYWLDKEFAEKVAQARRVKVESVEEKDVKRAPPAPFTTSTLQQAASARAKIRSKAAMDAAQKLFEAGFITYHRTDSPNLSDDGAAMVREELRRLELGEYVVEQRRTWRAKDGAQEGHEACRPSSFGPEVFEAVAGEFGEDSNEAKLYRLIWLQAMASQMADKRDKQTVVTLVDAEGIDGNELRFVAKGTVPVFDGWTRLGAMFGAAKASESEEGEDEEEEGQLPQLQQGQVLEAAGARVVEKVTRPPARFTEASLVKALEDRGIGRPSTFASIIENIMTRREYVVADKKGRLSPSAVAREQVIGVLRERFAFADLEFTKQVEELLDAIAEGRAKYKQVVAVVDDRLTDELARLESEGLVVRHACPDCGGQLRRRKGKSGHFWGCSNYPECEATFPDDDGAPGEREASYDGPAYPCPVCGKDMIPRRGANGTFWACTGYPECKTALDDVDGKPAQAYHCPEEGCNGLLRKLRAKKGPNKGKSFWSCTAPECKYTTADAGGKPA